ncbi:hypothetical protein JCM10450v2_001465 [Rhodotorula kratochvilovae]
MAAEQSTPAGTQLHPLLGLSPSSPQLAAFLASLSPSSASAPEPEVKAYSDIVYLNYRPLGLSLAFSPSDGYRPARTTTLADLRTEDARLTCTGIDLYNHDPAAAKAQDKGKARARDEDRWGAFPAYPVVLPSPPAPSSSTAPAPASNAPPPAPFPLTPSTTGAALLAAYGEPTRKGGGSSSTPSLGIWTEWTPQGLMFEWASAGLGAWEKGGESVWRCVSMFEPETKGAEGK